MKRWLAIVFILACIASVVGCRQEAVTSADAAKKQSPRLGSQLSQLVRAEEEGKGALFARQNAIVMVGNSVRVIVEVLPGQADAATRVAASLGVVEASDTGMLQVLVPIGRLTALADGPGVRLVRLPRPAAPQGGGQ